MRFSIPFASIAALILAVILAVPVVMAAESVKVRVGEHSGFDRLVFDWATPIGVKIESTPGQVRLIFDRAGDFDFSRVRKDPPPSVRGVTLDKDAKGMSVVVKIAPGSKVRLLESGSSAVLDILRKDTALDAAPDRLVKDKKAIVQAPKSTGPRTAPLKAVESVSTTGIGTPPTSLTSPLPIAPGTAQVNSQVQDPVPAAPRVPAPTVTPTVTPTATPSASVAAPLSLLDAPPPPEKTKLDKLQSVDEPVPAPQAAKVKPGKSAPKNKSARKKKRGGASKPPTKAAKSKPGKKPEAAPVKAVEKGRSGTLLVIADQGPSILDSTAINFFDGVPQTMNNLRFQWDAETALAVYRRGPYLWLVFDRATLGDVTQALVELAPELIPVEQFAAPNATLIRMTAPPIMEPKISLDGTTWVMELWPRPPRSTSSLEIAIEGGRTVSRVEFAIQSPGNPVSFEDPSSGVAMVVVPALIPEQGLSVAQAFPQFRALRSFQGLAMEVVDASLQVKAAGTGVQITHPDGLIVSKGATLALLKSNVRQTAVGPRLFDLPRWRRTGAGDFVTARQALQATLAESDLTRRPFARLDLARFYFAHGFAIEAAGLLRVSQTLDPEIPIDPETRLMRGVAAFLNGDYGAASKDLFSPSLNGEAEADLWNGAMAAVGFDWDVASKKFAENKHLIAEYPPRVRIRLWLIAAEAEMALNNLIAATQYMTLALNSDPNRDEKSQISVLTGYSHLKKDEKAKARSLWQSVVAFSDHPPSRTRARLAILDLAVALKTIPTDEAIAELERLRFAWRGDSIEIALLQRLGDLYLIERRYRDSLKAFRQATVSVPSSRFARDVAMHMRDVFFDIIAGDTGADLPPLSALALYEEFKELSPPSVKGDRMVERLADRLVEVDLLPRAAELLTSQVRYRLSGQEKATTGARVAGLHLLDDFPEKAMEVLGLSEDANLPEDLKRRRLYLRARALSRLARYEEAIKLISNDPYPEALRLRADILWGQASWRSAAVVLKQLVPEKPRDDQPLTNQDSRNVADLAIALTLSGEKAELATLGKIYKEAMATGPDRDTFALLTDGLAEEGDRSIAEQLASVKKAEDFMANYRKQAQETRAN